MESCPTTSQVDFLMQHIVVDKPYQFVPPYRGSWLPRILLRVGQIHTLFNRFAHGVVSHECRHVERLRESIESGHGVVIAPNHTRTADPAALGWLCESVPCLFYEMASWHLYNQGWLLRGILRAMGAFSVNRDGVDRKAINTAIDLLVAAERPLVIFPEGFTSRTTDRLKTLFDGIAFVARVAAKKRARTGGKVVVHPVAIKYHLLGNIDTIADQALTEIEYRLSWQPQRQLPLLDRVIKVGKSLFALKELEYFGETCSGSLHERISRLTNHLLDPLELDWIGKPQTGPTMLRVRMLRSHIMPGIIAGRIDAEERARRWRQIKDLYLAQHLSSYEPDYLDLPSVDRIFEMVEKFEEDLTDTIRRHPPLHCVLDVGTGIIVSPRRDRAVDVDPLLMELQFRLQGMLDELASESRLYEPIGSRDRHVETRI